MKASGDKLAYVASDDEGRLSTVESQGNGHRGVVTASLVFQDELRCVSHVKQIEYVFMSDYKTPDQKSVFAMFEQVMLRHQILRASTSEKKDCLCRRGNHKILFKYLQPVLT